MRVCFDLKVIFIIVLIRRLLQRQIWETKTTVAKVIIFGIRPELQRELEKFWTLVSRICADCVPGYLGGGCGQRFPQDIRTEKTTMVDFRVFLDVWLK